MKRNFFWLGAFLTILVSMFGEQPSPSKGEGNFDVIIRNGTVYDGTGAEPRQADVAIRGDKIAGIADFKSAKANTVIDAKCFVGRQYIEAIQKVPLISPARRPIKASNSNRTMKV